MAAYYTLKSGVWSDTTIWDSGIEPGEGDSVQIKNTHTVTLDKSVIVGPDSAVPAIDILSGGTLNWDNGGDDTLTLKGDLTVRSGGTITLDGTSTLANVLTINLNYSNALTAYKYEIQALAGSIFNVRGFDMGLSYVSGTVSGAVITTATDVSAGWVAGDRVVLQQTDGIDVLETTIGSITGTAITLADTPGASYTTGVYIWNRERNIIIKPYNNSYTCSNVFASADSDATDHSIRWAAILDLGRSDNGGFYCKNIDWRYCHFERTTANSQIETAFYLTSSTYAYVYRNVFYKVYSNYEGTIDLISGSGYIIAENLFSESYGGILYDIEIRSSANKFTINDNLLFGTATSGDGIDVANSCSNLSIYNNKIYGHTSAIILGASAGITLHDNKYYSNTSVYTNNGASSGIEAYDEIIGTGNTNGINVTSIIQGYFHDIDFSNATNKIITTSMKFGSKVRINNCTGINTGHKSYTPYGSYEKQSSVKYSGDYALLMNPTDADNELIAESTVFAKNGETLAYSCYMRKSASFAVLPYVKLSGAGITASTATMTNSTDTWELLTVSGVATEDGFCKIEFVCQNGNGSVYVDDDPDTFAYWFEGDVPVIVPKPSLTANDIWNTQTAGLTASGSVGKHVKGLRNTIEIG